MATPDVKVLDTANPTASPSDTGPTQTAKAGRIKENRPHRLAIVIASGDSVVVEGKVSSDESAFTTLHTSTASEQIDIYLPPIWRARRTVDGAAGDSQVYLANVYNEDLTTDAAS